MRLFHDLSTKGKYGKIFSSSIKNEGNSWFLPDFLIEEEDILTILSRGLIVQRSHLK
jgi:ribosome-interacting GTPase 1